MPNLIAYDICGVQPMSGPTGMIFAMRAMYDGPDGPNEAFFDEADPTFSNGANTFANGTQGTPRSSLTRTDTSFLRILVAMATDFYEKETETMTGNGWDSPFDNDGN